MINALFRWNDFIPTHGFVAILVFLVIECVMLFPNRQHSKIGMDSKSFSNQTSFEQFKVDFKRWKLDNASYSHN